MDKGFTYSDLMLSDNEWAELVERIRPTLIENQLEWLEAWELQELHHQFTHDLERQLLRYGHYLGWFDNKYEQLSVIT